MSLITPRSHVGSLTPSVGIVNSWVNRISITCSDCL